MAVKINPHKPDYLFLYASILIDQQKYKEGVEHYAKAIEADSSNIMALKLH